MAVTISYPGVSAPRSVRYTLTRGVMPDIAFLEMTSQATTIAANGDLVFADDSTTITLSDCRVNTSSLRVSPDGQVMQVQLWDRRHWWQYREITGRYNYMQANGAFDPAGQVDMRALAVLLLTAAGETGYDVSVLPNDQYPYVSWDHDTPMDELQELCHRYGYEVCWSPNTDVVTIVQDNVGSDLPSNTDVTSFSFSVTAGERPSGVKLVGAKKCYQSKLKLIAVGKDTDGSIVPIDDLSYMPAAGWTWIQGRQFDDVLAEFGEEEQRLAQETVFRWYLVSTQADGTLDVPGYGAVESIDDILPIDSLLNDTYTGYGGLQRYARAKVSGVWLPAAGEDLTAANTDPDEPYEGEFRIIESIGLVIFGGEYPVVKLDGFGAATEAEMYLECTYNVRDDVTHQPFRYEKSVSLGGAPALSGTMIVRHDELVERFTGVYGNPADVTEVTSVTNNTTAIDALADDILDQTVNGFGDSDGYVVGYRFLYDLSPGGKIWQVGWYVRMRTQNTPGGSDTVASQRTEFDPNILGWRDKKRLVRSRRRSRGVVTVREEKVAPEADRNVIQEKKA